ncbi:hypothetical protein ACWCPF_13815 [Streptomyces sp. NPDC001858]
MEELRLPRQLVSLGFGPERSVVQTAIEEAGWVRCTRCAYVGPSASHARADACTADTSADEQQSLATELAEQKSATRAGPARPGRAVPTAADTVVPVLAESGAAKGRLLPGADNPTWEAVPLHLRQQLRGPAQELVSPARGPLAARENRPVLSAVRAASRMRVTGVHWTLLLTTGRESFGDPRSQRAQVLYAALEQVAAQHAASGPATGSSIKAAS